MMIIGKLTHTSLPSHSNIWFTSDHHFGHVGILNWMTQTRKFKDVARMNRELIARHNSCVSDDDIVFHLGDLTLGRNGDEWLSKLKGRIYMCYMPCHHDSRWLTKFYDADTQSLVGDDLLRSKSGHEVKLFTPNTILLLPPDEGGRYPTSITMDHEPKGEWNGSYHPNNWHLHGHTHGNWKPNREHGFIHDVGVDANDLKPVSLESIKRMAAEWGNDGQ